MKGVKHQGLSMKGVKHQGLSMKGVQHNAPFVKNTREEHLATIIGMLWSSDLDMYDFEFNDDGSLKVIHMNAPETPKKE